MLFYATKYAVICYSSHRKLTQLVVGSVDQQRSWHAGGLREVDTAGSELE